MQQTDLSEYNNAPYSTGGTAFKRLLWYYVSAIIFRSGLFPFSSLKVLLLRLFGAQVGSGVMIKPCVSIKYPWLLSIGDHTWIGDRVLIDNFVMVAIGKNVCISQAAILQTGSHNYKKSTFDLITGNITLEDGVWIGCAAIVNQNITAGLHAVLTSGSVATKDLQACGIYQGNPAVKIRDRQINS